MVIEWEFCLKDLSCLSSPEPHFMSTQLVTQSTKPSKHFVTNKMKRRFLSYDFIEIQRKMGTFPPSPPPINREVEEKGKNKIE